MKKLLDKKCITQESFQKKQQQLQNYISQQQSNLQRVKSQLQQGYQQFCETVKLTRRDILFMEKIHKLEGEKQQ